MKELLEHLEHDHDSQIEFLEFLDDSLRDYARRNDLYYHPKAQDMIEGILLKLKKLEEIRYL